MVNDSFRIDELPYSVLRDVYRYWLDMKGDRAMPSRADLNPADIVHLLPHISLVDVERKTKRYRMRLIGTETVKVMGFDVTGKYLDELSQVEPHLKGRYDWLAKSGRPYFYSDKLNWSNKSFLSFSSIGLPLSSNGRDVDILMYGSCYQFPVQQSA